MLEIGSRLRQKTRLIPPEDVQSYIGELDLRPEVNITVKIEVILDNESGTLTWRLTSVDPATGKFPEDPLVGFLPPNTAPPAGEGNVTFSVMPQTGLQTGKEIHNKALITFDVNAPIETPEWVNTLDLTHPTSSVNKLPEVQQSNSFRLNWTGADEGSGVKDFTISVSEDGGPFEVWLRDTTATSGMFVGEVGKEYAWFSIARDQVGNMEDPPLDADTRTRVQIVEPVPSQVNANENDSRLTLIIVLAAVAGIVFVGGLALYLNVRRRPAN